MTRYNILNGFAPPQSGHWLNNPHADDIDFQIEADFAGLMSPGMPNSAALICDEVRLDEDAGGGKFSCRLPTGSGSRHPSGATSSSQSNTGFESDC
ncbi:MAG: hypothetical protein WBC70_07925 [Candidatus Aminicenantales bacterium]